MPLIANGKTYSSGRAYSADVQKNKNKKESTPVPSKPYTLQQLSKDINSGRVTNQGQLDTIVGGRGYGSSTPVASTSPSTRTNRSYGTVGINPTDTSYDSAGNKLFGSIGGRNVIGGSSSIDRTAGIPKSPMQDYLSMMQQNNLGSITDQLYKERRDQLDAIRQKYTSQVATEQAAGAEDLARMRSMNLRAGLGGSDFGAANKADVRNTTNKNVQAIQANQDIAIGNAMNNIEQLAQSRFQLQQSAMQQGFTNAMQMDKYTQQQAQMQIEQEQVQREQAIDSIAQLGKSGLGLSDIKEKDPQLYQSLQDASGMTDVELEAVLNNNKPAQERVDYKYKVVGGKIIAYGIDPVTGSLKTLEQTVDIPDNYSISTMPDGTVLAVPDQWDGDTSKIRTVGNYAKPIVKAGGGGGEVATTDAVPTTGLTDASGKRIKLTATQTEALSGYDNTIQASQDALALLQSGVQTGPIAGRMMSVGKLTGNVDTNQLKLEQLLGKIKADFMKAMSGAAVSEQEVQRLSKFLPDMNDQETVIESKLMTLQEEVARSKSNLLNTLGAVQQSSSEVEVRSPDGTIGTIPASQLQEALSEGYTQL